MNKIYKLLLFISLIIISTCKEDKIAHESSLNVLCVGSSFLTNTVDYVPRIMKATKNKNISLTVLYYPAATLEQHLKFYESNQKVYQCSMSDKCGWYRFRREVSLQEALAYCKWDIVVFQQSALNAGESKYTEPYLSKLIQIAKDNNKECVMYWNMTWTFSKKYLKTLSRYDGQQRVMYDSIVNNSMKINEMNKLIIIPSNATMQNLRNSVINEDDEFTIDGLHASNGAARYALGLTFLNIILSNKFTTDNMDYSFIENNLNISREIIQICEESSKKACNNKFEPYFSK